MIEANLSSEDALSREQIVEDVNFFYFNMTDL